MKISVCHDHVKTYTYQAVTEFIRQKMYVTFQLPLFMEVLYSSNMVCIGVRGKIPNSSWYCLFPAFLCIFYSRNNCCQNGLNVREQVNLSIGRGRVGRTLDEKNCLSPRIAYSCVYRRYNYVIITLLFLNFVNVIAMQETSGYDYRTTLNAS